MTLPQYNITKKRLKKLPDDLIEKVEGEVKAILHAHRDALRNRGMDSIRIPWDVTCGYFGEAFGIFRALHIMGYGYHGARNRGPSPQGLEREAGPPESQLVDGPTARGSSARGGVRGKS